MRLRTTHPLAKDINGAPLIVSAPPGYGPGDELVVLGPDTPALFREIGEDMYGGNERLPAGGVALPLGLERPAPASLDDGVPLLG